MRSEENRGLSARKLPCAATCASQAPSSAYKTFSAVASPPASTVTSSYSCETTGTSAPSVVSAGPRTSVTRRPAGGGRGRGRRRRRPRGGGADDRAGESGDD